MNVAGAMFAGLIEDLDDDVIDHPYAGIGVYAFTKAGVAMLTMTASLEAGPYGIRVNAIAPGFTVTPFTTWRLHKDDGSLDTEAYDVFIQQMKEMSPLNIVGEAEDQAQLILYLASDASKYPLATSSA